MSIEPLSPDGQEVVRRDCEDLKRLAREVFRKEICYDDASIEWLASVIEFSRNKPNEEVKRSLLEHIGSFLGEAIIARYGGEWILAQGDVLGDDGQTMGVRLPSGTIAFPYAKVYKQFKNGMADSIGGLFKLAGVPLRRNSQPGASPNGGPAAPVVNSGDSKGSPSVS